MHVWDIDPVYTRERHAALMETIRAEGQTTFLSVHRTRDGAEFPVEITAIWLPTAGQDSICAYVRDVSERKLRGP